MKLCNAPRGQVGCSLYKELVCPRLILTVNSNYADHEGTDSRDNIFNFLLGKDVQIIEKAFLINFWKEHYTSYRDSSGHVLGD